jgi:hypothetical protein
VLNVTREVVIQREWDAWGWVAEQAKPLGKRVGPRVGLKHNHGQPHASVQVKAETGLEGWDTC